MTRKPELSKLIELAQMKYVTDDPADLGEVPIEDDRDAYNTGDIAAGDFAAGALLSAFDEFKAGRIARDEIIGRIVMLRNVAPRHSRSCDLVFGWADDLPDQPCLEPSEEIGVGNGLTPAIVIPPTGTIKAMVSQFPHHLARPSHQTINSWPHCFWISPRSAKRICRTATVTQEAPPAAVRKDVNGNYRVELPGPHDDQSVCRTGTHEQLGDFALLWPPAALKAKTARNGCLLFCRLQVGRGLASQTEMTANR